MIRQIKDIRRVVGSLCLRLAPATTALRPSAKLSQAFALKSSFAGADGVSRGFETLSIPTPALGAALNMH